MLGENDGQLCKMMLNEPRCYPPLCCILVVPAKHPEAARGYIIMEPLGYPVISGGNTIAVVVVLLESGMLPTQVSHEGVLGTVFTG